MKSRRIITRLTELLRKSQSFESDFEMYEKFDEWRTFVNINCIAFNELKRRNIPMGKFKIEWQVGNHNEINVSPEVIREYVA